MMKPGGMFVSGRDVGDEGTHFFERPGYKGFGVASEALPVVKARFPEIPFDPARHPDARYLKAERTGGQWRSAHLSDASKWARTGSTTA
jgi:hypothetical protein